MSRTSGASTDAPVLSEDFDFDGRRVKHGCVGQGPAVVCVHGTPWSSFNLRHIIQGLSAHHTVYYYDLVGYGASSQAPGDVSLGVQNELLARLLAHWQLEAPAVVGHDFGGAICLRTHLLNRVPVRRIVLIDPVAVSPWGSAFFRHVRAHEQAFAGAPGYIHEAIVRAYVKSAAHHALDDDVLARTVQPWLGAEGQAAFYRQMAQADQRFTDEVQPLYGRIQVPVLIAWGREDAWIPLTQGQELSRLIPGSTLHAIDGAGHLVIEEKPQALCREILAFLGT